MPRPGSTKLAPGHRSAAADLRSKVIGTNTLITELTEQIRTLVEAQHTLVTTMTELVLKSANPTSTAIPDGRVAADMMREVSRSWGAQRASTLAQARPAATGDTIIGDDAPVPRGTVQIPQPTSEQAAYFEDLSQRHVQWSAPSDPNSFEPHPGPVWVDQPQKHSLDADMAAELAEYAEDEDDTPQPPDDAEQDDLWSRRLSLHRNMRMWKPEWGPRPGQTGCNVPAHLLNGRA